MKTKSNLDVLTSYIYSQLVEEFGTLSNLSGFVTDCLAANEACKKILSAYGFNFGTSAAKNAFSVALKNATFESCSNLVCRSEKVEKDEKGQRVTKYETKNLPAWWYDKETAEDLAKKGVKMQPLYNEFGVQHKKVVKMPVYKEEIFSYKDSQGATRTKTIKVRTDEFYDLEKFAYLKTRYKLSEVVNGLRNLIFEEDQKSTTSARLVREFLNAAKK